jgi:hypothetical protein
MRQTSHEYTEGESVMELVNYYESVMEKALSVGDKAKWMHYAVLAEQECAQILGITDYVSVVELV